MTAVFGGEEKIRISHLETCDTCTVGLHATISTSRRPCCARALRRCKDARMHPPAEARTGGVERAYARERTEYEFARAGTCMCKWVHHLLHQVHAACMKHRRRRSCAGCFTFSC
jgi:hypothetical protein